MDLSLCTRGVDMIFQLKVTLKDFKPPVWRRVEVRDTMTFAELHHVIQVAFEWTNSHLHNFQIKRMNSVPIDEIILISPKNEEFGFVSTFKSINYDEETILLNDIFLKEKDRVLYTYDFGDNWEHEIVLEKILPEQDGVFYPRCTKVMREVPAEDSRFEYLNSPTTPEINSKERMDEINEILESVFEKQEKNQTVQQKMDDIKETQSNAFWPRLLDAAEEFKKMKPWNWLSDDQLIAILHPDTEELYICSILGMGGIEFGLSAFRGINSIEFFNQLIFDPNFSERDYMKQDRLTVDFVNRDELSNKDYKLLKEYGRSYRGKNQWPVFRSYWPGFYPWFLVDEEVQELLFILEQLNNLCKNVQDRPGIIKHYQGDGRLFLWKYEEETGKWEKGQIVITKEENLDQQVPLYVNELELQHIKQSIKKSNVIVELDSDYVLTPIQENKNDRPYYPMLMLLAEQTYGQIVFYEMFTDDSIEAVQLYFIEFIKKFNNLPKEIRVKELLALQIAPIAKKLNIKLQIVNSLPIIEDAREMMEFMMLGH